MPDILKGLKNVDLEEVKEKVEEKVEEVKEVVEEKLKPVADIAKEVIQGKWGNGKDRETKLTEAGYDYSEIQKAVNDLLKK